jgi:hypothetical protein
MAEEDVELAVFRALGEAGAVLSPMQVSSIVEQAVVAAKASMERLAADAVAQARNSAIAELERGMAQLRTQCDAQLAAQNEKLKELRTALKSSRSATTRAKSELEQQREVLRKALVQAEEVTPELLRQLAAAEDGRRLLERHYGHAREIGVRQAKADAANRLLSLLNGGAFDGVFGKHGSHGPILRLARQLLAEADGAGGQTAGAAEGEADSVASIKTPQVDDVLRGTVAGFAEDALLLDIGWYEPALLPRSAIVDSAAGALQSRRSVEVAVTRVDLQRGECELSMAQARATRAWQVLTIAAREKAIIRGTVQAAHRDRLTVDVGVLAELPYDELEPALRRAVGKIVGHQVEAQVLSANQREGHVILSRRPWMALHDDADDLPIDPVPRVVV